MVAIIPHGSVEQLIKSYFEFGGKSAFALFRFPDTYSQASRI